MFEFAVAIDWTILLDGFIGALRAAVETATGWPGLVMIWIYSFLIAFILPGPSEVVLATPLNLGLGYWPEIGLIILVSGFGKAAGSVLAFHIGQEVKHSSYVMNWFKQRGYDVQAWSERQTVRMAERFGYVGLALALCVPGFPDTLSIYAFTVLEEDYLKFAAATFAGSIGRLLVTIAIVGSGLVLL